MLFIRYRTHGFVVEENTTSSAVVSTRNLTQSLLAENFPFEGTFHFRVKQRDALNSSSFCWEDVTSEGSVSIHESITTVDVQVIVLSSPEDTPEDYSDYYAVMTDRVKDVHVTAAAQMKAKKGPAGINLKSITKGATNVWNSLVSTASSMLKNSVPLTDEAEEQLAMLSESLSSSFSDEDESHVELLADLWAVLFPSSPFERTSVLWKQAGFQNSDPAKDLKLSGVLALECMVYMGDRYQTRARRMFAQQKANANTNYPLAIVGINITLLLASIVSLQDQRYLSAQAAYWRFFESPIAFFEVNTLRLYDMICIASYHLIMHLL